MKKAFTLIELLVVIAIVGILAGLSVPALKLMSRSTMNGASSLQLKQDLGHTRQLALSSGRDTYLVFQPSNQLSYCIMSFGRVSDQPGNHSWYQVTDWTHLDNNNMVHPSKFLGGSSFVISNWSQTIITNLPTVNINNTNFFCIGFDYTGRLVSNKIIVKDSQGNIINIIYHNEFVPIVSGYVDNGKFTIEPTSTNSGYMVIDIDGLTGFSSVQTAKVK